MKIIALVILFVACQAKENVSQGLKDAWSVVNSANDIYERYTQIENEIEMIDGQLMESAAEASSVADLDNRKMSAEQELRSEEEKILKTQKVVEKASQSELKILTSSAN